MLYNLQGKKLCRNLLVGGALLCAGAVMYSCSDGYDLGDKQPTGLDNIYGYMQEKGNFTNYLHLIDDLGQKEILSKTGSKTMFVSDDDAFAKFYASNSWGVKSYDELSLAQKKLLLYSSMIDNPYSTSMLSSAESSGNSGSPIKGEVCRRSSSMTLYDSILFVASKDADGILPDNDRFNEIRANHDSIVLFTDASNAAPMIHFTGKFVTSNRLSNTDIDFIYNLPEGTFKSDDVYVNNSKVIATNIFCKNGFVHQVDNVIVPLDNMAEIIRKNPQTSTFSGIIERFAAPDDSLRLTEAYNKTKGTSVDSIFVKRYFSKRSVGSSIEKDVPFEIDKNGVPFDALLKFDPGWNSFFPLVNNVRQPMMEDMAVMLVPTDEAMNDWWENKGGRVIKDYYHTIENTPNSVLKELVNVNMLPSFVGAVPSQFDGVLNDANEKMNISKDSIVEVRRGCNGLVYITSKVYAPTSYSSVLFPAVIDTTRFKVLYNVIENLNYDKYLNSMVSDYTFLLPTNKGLLSYVDPVSYGQTQSNLWEFHLDLSKGATKQLYADVYRCVLNEDGTWGIDPENPARVKQVTGGTDNAILKDRIEDLLDNIIVTEAYVPGKKYYKTKGRTFVKIEKEGDQFIVSGSWQEERKTPLKASNVFNMENGTAIVLDCPIMGTRRSVASVLQNTVDEKGDSVFSTFFQVMKACGAISPNNSKDGWQAGDQTLGNLFNLKSKGAVGAEDVTSKEKGTYLLNNFHYTVYAPTNEAMQKAFAQGTLSDYLVVNEETGKSSLKPMSGLPTLEMLDEAEAFDDEKGYDAGKDTASVAAKIKEAMLDFVKYHIQDNSIFVDEGFVSGEYESGKTELIKSISVDEETGEEVWSGKFSPGRPYKINVNVSASGIELVDAEGKSHNVITKPGLYNIMAREYWFGSSSVVRNPWEVQLNNSSAVVVHAIDSALFYDSKAHTDGTTNQFTYSYKPLTSE